MNTQGEKVNAARTLAAGLKALLDYADGQGMPAGPLAPIREALSVLETSIPPWTPEPGPDAPIAWSLVACGDEVQAPNGQWYRVTGLARVGQQVTAMLNETIRSSVKATDKVPTRRGPTGQAMDVLMAGGLELELIGVSE